MNKLLLISFWLGVGLISILLLENEWGSINKVVPRKGEASLVRTTLIIFWPALIILYIFVGTPNKD